MRISQGQDDYYANFLEMNTRELLDILKKYSTQATFFVLGSVAYKYPKLIKIISQQGHEVATHGLHHRCIYKSNPEEFRRDVSESVHLLESIITEKVWGFRAPYFSITKDSLWALDILESLGLKYDSSIFPFKRGNLYGIPDSRRFPYRLSEDFWEFPLATARIWHYNIPIGGGGYFRLLPYWFIRGSLRKIDNLSEPAVIYLHPYEINPAELRRSFPGESRKFKFIKYSQAIGRKRIKIKLISLLKEFNFTSIKGYLSRGKTG